MHRYATLTKFDVQIAASEIPKLQQLRLAWKDFQEMLDESRHALDKSKVNMKRDLEANLESYSQQVMQLREQLVVEIPVSQEMSPDEAYVVINDFKRRVEAVHDRKRGLRSGLEIFNIESPDHKELRDTEHDLELAGQIWTLARDWTSAFDRWKTGRFNELDIGEMETAAGQFNKKVAKLGREIKRWGIWEQMRAKLTEFLQTMPLIQDLRNPAMRARHWATLKKEIHRDFDETGADFTLEAVFLTGLNAVPDLVSELSANANKELAIEDSLKDIETRWAKIEIEIASYKETYYKIRNTDDLFQALEDDAVSLSTMKASKFYGSFKPRIDKWEFSLALVSEFIEVILTVQRKWIYLESIFMASEDICKQLPKESALFMEVNTTFTGIMSSAAKRPNAIGQCTATGMLENVTGMDDKLEAIQKSLDSYF